MYKTFSYPSAGAGQICGCAWTPEGDVKGVVQIIHGIADFSERYASFAEYLNGLGFLVVAEDHMGHGRSVGKDGIQGYFHGGWFAAVEDCVTLLNGVRGRFPELPYVLFGHSMGSFLARSILARYPDCGLTAAVLCGTGWQPRALLPGAIGICEAACKMVGEQNPSQALQNLVFGTYNARVEHPRTAFDWVSRDSKVVDDYVSHPWCGFVACTGLLRDLLKGVRYIEEKKSLGNMKKTLPVLFVSGGDDPVGGYGKGVRRAAEEFRKAGMEDVTVRIFPLCRHEILNEINREEIFDFLGSWMKEKITP